MADAGDSWGRLIPLFGEDKSPVEMKSDLFSIGRRKDCNLKLSIPVISGCHCSLIRDPDGNVWLQDTSTNGTVINSDQKLLDDVCEIEHNTEFHIVFRRNAPSECIGYRFENISKLNSTEETAATAEQEEDLPEDKTQEISNDVLSSEASPEAGNGEAEAGNEVEEAATAPEEEDEEDKKDLKRSLLPDKESSCAAKRLRKQPSSPRPGPSREAAESSHNDDGLLETLICAICREILYDCVSVQPCLHSFCAGCFSDWMQGSCPQCRKSCSRVSRNHLVNNVVEEYLKKHPEQQRCQEDRDDLDRKNKIKDNVVNLSHSADSDDSDSEFSGFGSPISASALTLPPAMGSVSGSYTLMQDLLSSLSSAAFDVVLDFRPVCRQCPNASNWSFRNGPPTRAVQTPAFVCNTIGTLHVLCQCCLEAMPQRSEPEIDRQQRCAVCRAHYCRQYFGCSPSCFDCLMPLKDSNLTGPIQFDLIMRNGFESRVLLNYMRGKDVSLRQLMTYCAENFTTHQYFTPSYPTVPLTPESLVCRACSHRLLREFAYHYRSAIDPNELPPEVRIRPDCRWGRNCRTQIRPHHAERYNHICEQTQFETSAGVSRPF